MKDSKIKMLLMFLVMTILAIAYTFLFAKFSYNGLNYIIYWTISLVSAILLFGYDKDNKVFKRDIAEIVFIYSFIYLILCYLGGLIFGFTKSPYSMEFIKIIKNITPILIIIILQEKFRYVVLNKFNKDKYIKVLLVFLYVGLNILLFYGNYNMKNGLEVFEFIAILLIPSIVDNIMLSYMTEKVGSLPSILYRIIFELYIYLIPIIPDLGLYLESVTKIVLPMILLIRVNTLFAKQKPIITTNKKVLSKLFTIILVSILVIIVMLVSNLFSFKAIAIMSNSMQKVINRGDVVIIEKEDFNQYEVAIGDIIAYKHEDKVIVHRVVKKQLKNKDTVYITKGDNNDNIDAWFAQKDDIIGIVKVVVPYVGYPTVWFTDKLKN